MYVGQIGQCGIAFLQWGVTFLQWGVAFLKWGVTFLKWGVTFLQWGVTFLQWGVTFLQWGVAFFQWGVAFFQWGVAFLPQATWVVSAFQQLHKFTKGFYRPGYTQKDQVALPRLNLIEQHYFHSSTRLLNFRSSMTFSARPAAAFPSEVIITFIIDFSVVISSPSSHPPRPLTFKCRCHNNAVLFCKEKNIELSKN